MRPSLSHTQPTCYHLILQKGSFIAMGFFYCILKLNLLILPVQFPLFTSLWITFPDKTFLSRSSLPSNQMGCLEIIVCVLHSPQSR